MISATLREQGLAIDLLPMKAIQSTERYRAAVLGSAVNHANWLPEAIDFITKFQDALHHIPVALFTVHITNIGKDDQSRANRLAYLDEVRKMIEPVDEVFFPGRFDRQGAKELLPKWIAWIVPTMDFRKWDQIRAWAQKLPKLLIRD